MSQMTLQKNHVAMVMKYSGISFISGAVNHGFFSGTRSVLTAALGVALFAIGAWLEQRWSHEGVNEVRPDLFKTLLLGTVLSVGLGFFTGGLQHFQIHPYAAAGLCLWGS